MRDLLTSVDHAIPTALHPWILLAAALALALLAHRLAWRLVLRLTGQGRSLAARVLFRARRPARLGFVVVALPGLAGAATFPLGWTAVLVRIAVALLIVVLGWVALIAIDVIADRQSARLRLDAEDNLAARKQVTQIRVLQRVSKVVAFLLTAGIVLSTFESVRQYGVSLFASAGAAGLVLGFAARPVLANLIAGIQIALTQPIRLDDVVIVENEWGWIEEIASTYVVVRLWDLRRLVVPLSHFIEKPFQNWTRESASIIGTVFWHLDYTAPVGAMREKLKALAQECPLWDGKVVNLQVTEAGSETIEVRALVSARNSPAAWDLRCEVREGMLEWLQEAHPGALPRTRGELTIDQRREPPSPGGGGLRPGADGSGVPREAWPVQGVDRGGE
ncbi:membrane protein [Oceanicola granulosus HTCC2516]|uniref:Membrane protein n=1 Tax=Oceanicola granulosus (strain ATCC BAA-861 / DSM 15982 / KCTC 12143 / HTCC2516) TaxID=314256 RepID=Q2CFJ0_OCEGH|nr:mechanosensitive ion channel domain-containing protein [Oceanicola granulosus]EAR51492.1 membrane protein [Oceanicola granulosus HTCC2516]